MTQALGWVAAAIGAMWLLYAIGIQYKRGGWCDLFVPFAFAAFLMDVALNYTLLAALTWDWPRAGEYTFSKKLKRLLLGGDWRASFAYFIVRWMLNPVAPGGVHVALPKRGATDAG
jgi:hypothetical protein